MVMTGREPSQDDAQTDVLRCSADIVAAYVAQNATRPEAIEDLINTVHATLAGLGKDPVQRAPERRKPAVPVARSIHDDYLICLEDGQRLKMLKRYLRSRYDMSPEDYRRKWGLPPDYPMVAPNYAAKRSQFAKQIGLGRGVRRRAV
jgi:predicted transcriptional regulator